MSLLAVAAIVLIFIPSRLDAWRPLYGDWSRQVTLVLGSCAALLACILAVALVFGRPRTQGAGTFAAVLALGALAFGLWSAPASAVASLLNPEVADALRQALLHVAMALTFAGALRLSVIYPAPARRDRLAWLHHHLFPLARSAWLAGAGLGVLAGAVALTEPSSDASVLVLYALLLGTLAPDYMQASYAAATPRERGRALWILQGLLLAGAVIGVGMAVWFVGVVAAGMGGFGGGISAAIAGVGPVSVALGALVFLFVLASVAFREELPHPAATIHRTTVYGGLAFMLVAVFALAEELTTGLLAPRLGLPSGTGAAVGAAVVAVVLAPLHGLIRRRADRLFGRDIEVVGPGARRPGPAGDGERTPEGRGR